MQFNRLREYLSRSSSSTSSRTDGFLLHSSELQLLQQRVDLGRSDDLGHWKRGGGRRSGIGEFDCTTGRVRRGEKGGEEEIVREGKRKDGRRGAGYVTCVCIEIYLRGHCGLDKSGSK